jgi:hypothetical protein
MAMTKARLIFWLVVLLAGVVMVYGMTQAWW